MKEFLILIRPAVFGAGVNVVAALSTRYGGVAGSPFGMNLSYNVGDDPAAVTRNRDEFFGSLGIAEEAVALMQQVHSSTVLRTDVAGTHPACDGMMTGSAGLYLCVTVADCVPVFIMDRRSHALAAVHAGWRGSAAGIVRIAVEGLIREYGAQPERMEAFIGPSAGVCCYEVGADVVRAFGGRGVTYREEKAYVDLKGVNRAQLLDMGVPAARVEVHTACTIHEAGVFHSYRRDGKRSGRMLAVVGFRG